ncbi:hypothetical protein Q3G72_030797 [Acer saccharum]|nr:hypothetical protein Q3G72_030797 [Acer saccharum]
MKFLDGEAPMGPTPPVAGPRRRREVRNHGRRLNPSTTTSSASSSHLSDSSTSYAAPSSASPGELGQRIEDVSAFIEVTVSIFNFQSYRHVDEPGWRVSWAWSADEVIIWSMVGAEATEQGNCSAFQARVPLPHCCEKRPVIVDLLPGAPYNQQTKNCCKGGV